MQYKLKLSDTKCLQLKKKIATYFNYKFYILHKIHKMIKEIKKFEKNKNRTY